MSKRVEGKSRLPESRWKVIPQSRTGGRETPTTEFVMCSWHKQLPQVIGIGPQWATTNVRQKATVVGCPIAPYLVHSNRRLTCATLLLANVSYERPLSRRPRCVN